MNRESRFRDSYMLAGWLFADLMLALALLFFASNTVGSTAQPTPTALSTPTPTTEPTSTPRPTITATVPPTPRHTPTVTHSPTPTVTTTPSPTPCIEQVSLQDPLNSETTIAFDPGQGISVEQVRAVYAEAFDQNKRAGLVLTFGSSPDPLNRDEGRTFAEHFNRTLIEQLNPVFNQRTEVLSYWQQGLYGTVTVIVYFIASTCE